MYGCVRSPRRVPRWGISAAAIAACLVLGAGAGQAEAKKRPDLIVSSVGNPPATIAAGASLKIKDRVENRRAKAKRSATGFFLSADEFRDLGDSALGSHSVGRLKQRKSARGSAEGRVPSNAPSGSYFVLACADVKDQVKERNETNNCKASKRKTQVIGPAPGDTTPPAVPTITDTDPDSPANDNQPEVKGTGAEAGATIRIFGTSDCSGSPLGSGTATAFGSGGITATVADNQTTLLRAAATDAAGNRSGCSAPFAYVENSTLPPAPSPTATTPASPANDNSPEVKGNAQAGSTVRIYATAACTGSPLATGSAASFTEPGITVNVADDSVTGLRATATDAAGNTSACSNPLVYVEDSTAPGAPSINDTDPNSPANDTTPQVKGAGAEAGSTVKVYDTATCTGSPIGQGGAAQFAGGGITATVSANATTQLRVTATDAAGNASSCSGAFAYVQDSIDPATPSVTDTDPNSPANDDFPEVKGSGAETGSTIRIYATAGCTGAPLAVGSDAQFEGAGITVHVADDSTTNLRATATDAANNVSGCSAPLTYVEDSTAPAPPTITSTDPASPSAVTGPNVLGTAEPGTLVSVFTTAGCTGSSVVGAASVFAGSGIPVLVPAATATPLTAWATDAAGNTSSCSAPFVYDTNVGP